MSLFIYQLFQLCYLVGAKYLRVGNCLFLCVQGWEENIKKKKILQNIPGGYLAAEIDPYVKFYYNPPINFRVILLATNSQDGYHAITPACVNICPPIISIEKKTKPAEKSQLKKFTFSSLSLYKEEKTNSFCRCPVMFTAKSWSQILFRKVQKCQLNML